MKKLIYISSFFAITLFFSCNVLELESPDSVLESEVFNTIDGFRNARIGMYNTLSSNDYYGGTFPLLMDGTSDNGKTGGYASVTYDEIGAKAITPTNAIIEKLWVAQYKTIAIANQIISKIDKLDVKGTSVEEKNNIKGEAYFMRAICHFDALRTWGEHWDKSSEYGIPVVTTILSFESKAARNTVQASYDAIKKDLETAAQLVSADGKTKNYITPEAVKALQARVALYEGDKAAALNYANSIVSNTNFALFAAADYSKIFSNKKTSESIFELGFTTQNRSQFNQLTYARPEALRPEVLFMISESLNIFFKARPTDVRAKLVNFVDNDASIQPDGRTEKYRGEQTRDNPAYLFRLAEMYLVVAEAGGKSDGLNVLNTLRASRGMGILSISISDENYAQAVEDERRAELNMEGHRYFDLARLKKIESTIGTGTKPVLPIPQRELVASGGLMKQNRGY